MANPPGYRYIFLDGMRGIAALTIVLHHFTQHSSGHRVIFSSASAAVELFFCLSGFVLSHSYHEKLAYGMSITDYAKKRLVRLYPMYVIGLVFGISVIVLMKTRHLTDLSSQAIENASLLNLFFMPYLNSYEIQIFVDRIHGATFPFNAPAWSLFFGLVASFFYALTIRWSRKAPIVCVIVSGIALYVVTARFGESPGWGTENFIGGFPRVFFSFFTGVVIFQLQDKLKVVPTIKPAYLMGLVILLLAVPAFEGHKVYWIVAGTMIVPLIVMCSSQCVIEKHSFWHKACAYSGRISYPVYSVHFPLLMVISVFFGTDEYYALLMICSCLVTIVLAHTVMKYADEPVRYWLGEKLVQGQAGGLGSGSIAAR